MRQIDAKRVILSFQLCRSEANTHREVEMGLYKRGDVWWLTYTVAGKQVRESSKSENKRLAEAILAKRKAGILEGRWSMRQTDAKQGPGKL